MTHNSHWLERSKISLPGTNLSGAQFMKRCDMRGASLKIHPGPPDIPEGPRSLNLVGRRMVPRYAHLVAVETNVLPQLPTRSSGSFQSEDPSSLRYENLIRRRPRDAVAPGSHCPASGIGSSRFNVGAVSRTAEREAHSLLALKDAAVEARQNAVEELSRDSLAALLEFAAYSPTAVAAHMRHFNTVVKQHLGPAPDANDQTVPAVKSFMTEDYGPVEFSVDWRKGEEPVVRYVVEPLGSEEEHRDDPIQARLAAARSLLHKDHAQQGDFQLDALTALLWEQYMWHGNGGPVSTHLEAQSQRLHLQELRPDRPEVAYDLESQFFLGWDLGREGGRRAKSYIIPQILCPQLQQPAFTLLAQLLPTLDAACTAGLAKLLSYISSRPKDRRPQLMFVASDVLHGPGLGEQNRLKLYLRIPTFFWPHVLDTVGLGRDVSAYRAELYAELWTCTTGAPPAATPAEAQALAASGPPFLYVTVDLLQGHSIGSSTKLHIPAKHLAPDDYTVAVGLERFLERRGYRGWHGYSDMIARSFCAHRSLFSRAGLHSYVSCSFKSHGETDPVITAYIHPEIYAPERKR